LGYADLREFLSQLEAKGELKKRLQRDKLGGRIVAGLLLVTVILMASARYLPSF